MYVKYVDSSDSLSVPELYTVVDLFSIQHSVEARMVSLSSAVTQCFLQVATGQSLFYCHTVLPSSCYWSVSLLLSHSASFKLLLVSLSSAVTQCFLQVATGQSLVCGHTVLPSSCYWSVSLLLSHSASFKLLLVSLSSAVTQCFLQVATGQSLVCGHTVLPSSCYWSVSLLLSHSASFKLLLVSLSSAVTQCFLQVATGQSLFYCHTVLPSSCYWSVSRLRSHNAVATHGCSHQLFPGLISRTLSSHFSLGFCCLTTSSALHALYGRLSPSILCMCPVHLILLPTTFLYSVLHSSLLSIRSLILSHYSIIV